MKYFIPKSSHCVWYRTFSLTKLPKQKTLNRSISSKNHWNRPKIGSCECVWSAAIKYVLIEFVKFFFHQNEKKRLKVGRELCKGQLLLRKKETDTHAHTHARTNGSAIISENRILSWTQRIRQLDDLWPCTASTRTYKMRVKFVQTGKRSVYVSISFEMC